VSRLQAWAIGIATAIVAVMGALVLLMGSPVARRFGPQTAELPPAWAPPDRRVERAQVAAVEAELEHTEAELQIALNQPTLDAQTQAVSRLLEGWNP